LPRFCSSFRAVSTVSRADKHIVIITNNCARQLRSIVAVNLKTLLEDHHEWYIHRCTKKRNDLRCFPRFRRNLESTENYRKRKVVIQLLLSSDGFKFKGHERGNTWIVSCVILDLPKNLRRRKRNTLLVASVSCGGSPSEEVFRIALADLQKFLSSCRRNPLKFNYCNEEWSFHFKVTASVMDNQASIAMSGSRCLGHEATMWPGELRRTFLMLEMHYMGYRVLHYLLLLLLLLHGKMFVVI
ncbi:hypothetical protein OESDEN_07401, partial [Oesophagostomum dentatum]